MTASTPHFSSLEEILKYEKAAPPMRMAVAAPHDATTLRAVAMAVKNRVAQPILIGSREIIEARAGEAGLDLTDCTIEDVDEKSHIVHAVQMIHERQADFLMKGLVQTSKLLRTVLDKQWGLSSSRLLSHVTVFEHPQEHRLLLMTDAGVNVNPNVARKIDILQNAVEVAITLGIAKPRVAILAAVENVQLPAMPATLHGELIKRYAAGGLLKYPCHVDGPLALDNAVSPTKAAAKGIGGPVAGQADVLVLPNIESGNIFYKALTSLHGDEMAGVVVGARCPLVVPSRADSPMTKLYCITLASFVSRMRNEQ